MPRPTKEVSIGRLERQLSEIPELKQQRYDSSALTEWQRNTRVAIAYTFGEESRQVNEFKAIRYSPFATIVDDGYEYKRQYSYAEGLDNADSALRSMVLEIQEYWEDDLQDTSVIESPVRPQTVSTNRVFVIHGRDYGTRDTVARFLEGLGLEAVILEEQPDRGLTVIEKFEENASGDFVVALLTPDDVGGLSNDQLQPRARQNVILELGYFIGRLGRDKVRALVKGDLEIPSDYAGVLYIPMDEASGWQMRLIREMKNAGLDIDANRAL